MTNKLKASETLKTEAESQAGSLEDAEDDDAERHERDGRRAHLRMRPRRAEGERREGAAEEVADDVPR